MAEVEWTHPENFVPHAFLAKMKGRYLLVVAPPRDPQVFWGVYDKKWTAIASGHAETLKAAKLAAIQKARPKMTPEQIEAYAEKHTRDSMRLAGREVPEGHVRSPEVEAILARRKERKMIKLPDGWVVDTADGEESYSRGREASVFVDKHGVDLYSECLSLNDLDGLIEILQLIQRKHKGE